MQVSVEALKGLERKMTVSVPAEKMDNAIHLQLKKFKNAKIAGFRPGKVPMSVIKSRYLKSIMHEVADEILKASLVESLEKEGLMPIATPSFHVIDLQEGKDFQYSATFEVYPEIELQEVGAVQMELLQAKIKEEDLDYMLERLRENHKTWKEVSRPVEENDKVIIDFKGFIDGQPIKDAQAENQTLIIGSKSMIEGFEEGILSKESGQTFDISLCFPLDYTTKNLAGKDAVFTITLHKVMQGFLPEIDADFLKLFGLKETTLDALKENIRENMQRELERRLKTLNHERIFDEILKINTFDLPHVLVNKEIEHLKHDMYHRMFGHEHSEHEVIPDFPRELFEKQATRRVKLGLLLSKYVETHKLAINQVEVEALIDQFSQAYEDAEGFKKHYLKDKQKRGEIEALVLENMVANKISQHAIISMKEISYDEAMRSEAAKIEQSEATAELKIEPETDKEDK